MKRVVEAKTEARKAARLLRTKARHRTAANATGTEPDGQPPSPAFPAARGLRSGALLSFFADSAVATRAAA